jgi:nucleoside-diphosphate-sugar epimerase
MKDETHFTGATVDHSGTRVLVTGGTGFLGRPLVRRLVADGYNVRVLARRGANVQDAQKLGVEVCWGDVGDVESFGRALAGCNLIAHLAAGTSGSAEDSQTATLQGTRNLLELCRKHRPRRLVYISTCSVYGIADQPPGALISETSPLERFPEMRGSYTATKLEAERYVSEFMSSAAVSTVILRPGTIYGPEGRLYTPMMGFSLGSVYVVIGRGGFVLPLVYVDNLVDAILLSLEKDAAVGQVFNVVDPDRVDKRTYMNKVMRRVDSAARVLYLPYSLLYTIAWLQERVFGLVKRPPVLSCYRLTSSQKSVLYDCRRLVECLGWGPVVSAEEGMERIVTSELVERQKNEDSASAGLVRTMTARRPADRDSAH